MRLDWTECPKNILTHHDIRNSLKSYRKQGIELPNMIQHMNHIINSEKQPNGSYTNNMVIKVSKFKDPSEG